MTSLELCPDCKAEGEYATCERCEGSGVLDDKGQPFHAPAPFAGWKPEKLVSLSDHSLRRKGAIMPTADDTATVPRRALTLSEIVDRLLSRTTGEHSSVALARNARGDTQITVTVRTGEGDIATVEQARMKAEEQYDHLCKLYPLAPSRPSKDEK